MVNGTLIWYSYICDREVWFIGHQIEASQDNPFLEKGRAIHEVFYSQYTKELLIDNTIKIDIVKGRELIAEIKSSSKHLKSAIMQLAFYLYYLKKHKGVELRGILSIPSERRTEEVQLSESLERELEEKIKGIEDILSLPKPPPPVKIPYCKNCAYKEICWA
ncbi:MAG: CRISPR-associated protein Cas4 [Thermocrinis sp.]|nr:CRISPR-associated protein Cas4 [Thermocrinis sp.]